MSYSKDEAIKLAGQYQGLKGKPLPDGPGTITDIAVFPTSMDPKLRDIFMKELRTHGTTKEATAMSAETDYDVWVIGDDGASGAGDSGNLKHYPLEKYLEYLAA